MGVDGFSTTVFCYGQTGSGKTHTLTGPPYLVRDLQSVRPHLSEQFNLRLFTFIIQEKVLTEGKNSKEVSTIYTKMYFCVVLCIAKTFFNINVDIVDRH